MLAGKKNRCTCTPEGTRGIGNQHEHDETPCSYQVLGSCLQLDRGHVAVITLLRVASPQQLVTLEGTHALVDFLELG